MMFRSWGVGILCAVSCPLFSHPPTRVSFAYDAESHRIIVSVFHPVEETRRHYVDAIVLKLQGREVVKQSFLSQADRQKQEVSYLLHDAKSGDQVEITASCNVFGKKKETYQIP